MNETLVMIFLKPLLTKGSFKFQNISAIEVSEKVLIENSIETLYLFSVSTILKETKLKNSR